jgi:hypothetical protein
MVPKAGLEPARGVTTRDFESRASANSATSARLYTVTIAGVAGFFNARARRVRPRADAHSNLSTPKLPESHIAQDGGLKFPPVISERRAAGCPPTNAARHLAGAEAAEPPSPSGPSDLQASRTTCIGRLELFHACARPGVAFASRIRRIRQSGCPLPHLGSHLPAPRRPDRPRDEHGRM